MTIKTVEILKTSSKICSLQAPDNFENDIRGWLFKQGKLYNLDWFLAHADDGVIWGKIGDRNLLLSSDYFSELPCVAASLRAITLQQARLFGINGELLIWRNGTGKRWQARLLQDGKGVEKEYYDEDYLLWGKPVRETREGFTLLKEGSQGFLHAPPIGKEFKFPLTLQVRHYIDYDSDGQAYIPYSRLMSFK